VNLVDVYAERALADHAVYSAAKAGLVMLTRSLAQDLAPEVQVNAIAPGAILWPSEGPTDGSEAARQRVLDRIPVGRMGTPEEVAAAVLFLAQAPYVTGQVLRVDGGRHLV
jgi:pteridine reductase